MELRPGRIINCCCATVKYSVKKYPHCWYLTHNTIVKCYYCPKHKNEVFDPAAFKTKNQLLTYLTTRSLLDEEPNPPIF